MKKSNLHWWLIILALTLCSVAFILGTMEYYLSAAVLMLFSPSLSMVAVAYHRAYHALESERSDTSDQAEEA